jgi:hypothetical protein
LLEAGAADGAADAGGVEADGDGDGVVFGAQPYKSVAAMTKTRIPTTILLKLFIINLPNIV